MRRRLLNKKGDFNFVWLFALMVGVAILIFAIYGASKAGETSKITESSTVAKQLSTITDPLQAGFADSSYGKISFRQETRIMNECQDEIGNFGRNEISVSTHTNVGEEKWSVPGVASMIYNKYIFSKRQIEGTEFFVMSGSFELPYKVSDIMIMTSEYYCFEDAPDEIIEEVEGLGISNIETEDCLDNEDLITVCFDGNFANCEVSVYGACTDTTCKHKYEYGTIQKGSDFVKYYDFLLYAGIMSDYYNYQCNVKRLLYRVGSIAKIYAEKADLMSARNCGSASAPGLLTFAVNAQNSGADEILDLLEEAKQVETANEREICGLWD